MEETKLFEVNGYIVPEPGEAGCDEAGRGCLAGPVVGRGSDGVPLAATHQSITNLQ